MNYQEILDQIEWSLALLEPPALRVKPMSLSFERGWFSGVWAKYQPEESSESVDVFIPHNELKAPYHLRTDAEGLIKSGAYIEVYPLRIDTYKKSCDLRKWQVPICTMFSPLDRETVVMEAEEIKSTTNACEINIEEGTVFEGENFKLEVILVEYHKDEDRKRPKAVVLRITAASKYPIIRLEQEHDDFKRWESLREHSDRKSSVKIKRFFYEKKGKNAIKIGDTKITLLPFFSSIVKKEMEQLGYVGKLRIKRGDE